MIIEEILKKMQKERIMKLKTDLEIIMANAPKEEKMTENEESLYRSINYVLKDIDYVIYEE